MKYKRISYSEYLTIRNEHLKNHKATILVKAFRLNKCQAEVCYEMDTKTNEYVSIHLKSYNTYVAAIIGDTCYDCMRVAYGYTRATNQHISKFMQAFNVKNKIIVEG